MKHLNLVSHSAEYLKLERIDRRHFFEKMSAQYWKWLILYLNDFWNFQILSAPSLKTTYLHRRHFCSNFCVGYFPFRLLSVFSNDAEAYSEPFQTYFKHKMEIFTKIAIDCFGKKLHLIYLIGHLSKFTVPELLTNTFYIE